MIESRTLHLVYQAGDLAHLLHQILTTLRRNYPSDRLIRRYERISRRADARQKRRHAAWAKSV